MVFDPKGQFLPVFEFPETLKMKAIYFIKPEENFGVTKDNVSKLIRGDIAPSRVDALNVRVSRRHR